MKVTLRKGFVCLLVCSLGLVGAWQSEAAPEDGLLLYCPFDGSLESDGPLKPAHKESGEIEFGEGVRGQALGLSAESFVDLSAEGLIPKEAGTISFWAKPNWHRLRHPVPPFRHHLLSYTGNRGAGTWLLFYWYSNNGVVCSFAPGKKRGKHIAINPRWREKDWNHIAVTWQAGNSVRIFVNGEAGPQYGDVEDPIIGAANGIRLGGEVTTIAEASLDGLLDELRIWNRPLSAQEIGQDYAQSLPEGIGQLSAPIPPATEDGWVNVKTGYGAVGDGVADDTRAMQNAFSSGRSIFLPEGTYRVTDTLDLDTGTCVRGEGCGFTRKVQRLNRTGVSRILYDGPEGGTVVLASGAPHTNLRNFVIDGNMKAAVGLQFTYSYSFNNHVEDVMITRTMEHGLLLTQCGLLTFDGLYAYGNYGNGVTLGLTETVSGVNGVRFLNCTFNNNGLANEYDGVENVAAGYGFGTIGHVSVCTVRDTVIERNGGPAIYVGPYRAVEVTFSGVYTESNGTSVAAATAAWARGERPDEPLGKRVAIIVERSPQGSPTQGTVTFENVFTAGSSNAIWLKGSQPGGEPIRFKHVYKPWVIYSEHGNWEWIDSTENCLRNIVKATGILQKGQPQFRRITDIPTGHPGILVRAGQRQVIPFDPTGITLYIDTDDGDDTNDGRSPQAAWASFSKVSQLFNSTILDTPYIVEVSGEKPLEGVALRNMTGEGTLYLRLNEGVVVPNLALANITCRAVLEGAADVELQEIAVDRCPAVSIYDLRITARAKSTAAEIKGSSSVRFLNCEFVGSNNSGTGVSVTELSRMTVVGGEISGFADSQGVVTGPGAAAELREVENRCGQSEQMPSMSPPPVSVLTEQEQRASTGTINWLRARREYLVQFPVQAVALGLDRGGFFEGIEQGFKGVPGISVQPFDSFTPEALAGYNVIMFPATLDIPRSAGDWRNAVRSFVEQGGGVIFSHNSVGRQADSAFAQPLFPQVCAGYGGRVAEDLTLQVLAKHPSVGDLETGNTFQHEYFDHLYVKPGPQGTTVLADSKGNPVMVVGQVGKGFVVYTGQIFGLRADDGRVESTGDEWKVLYHAVRWAASGKTVPMPEYTPRVITKVMIDFEAARTGSELSGYDWDRGLGLFRVRKAADDSLGHGKVVVASELGKEGCQITKTARELSITGDEQALVIEADFFISKKPTREHVVGIGSSAWYAGPRFGVGPNCIVLYGRGADHRYRAGGYPLVPGHWYRMRLVLDLTANPTMLLDEAVPADGAFSLFIKDLSAGDAAFTPVEGLQDKVVGLSQTTPVSVPASQWVRVWVASFEGDTVEIDNIRVSEEY